MSLEDWATDTIEQVSLTDRKVAQIKRLTGKSRRFFSEKAMKMEHRACWEPHMKVDVHEGRVAWVAKNWNR